METRHKMPLRLIADSLAFKQSIKASSSEIIKDLLQMNESAGQVRKQSIDSDCKKGKNSKSFCGRKNKLKITEDVGPVLGLATLMNEMHDPLSSIVAMRNEVEEEKVVKIPKNKKTVKSNKQNLLKFTRAGTHLAIAFFIKQKNGKIKLCR